MVLSIGRLADLRAQTVVASGTLFVEEKFVRSCGKVRLTFLIIICSLSGMCQAMRHCLSQVGHIEDVVVDKNVRGLHLGQR